jgi:hypothetical protein
VRTFDARASKVGSCDEAFLPEEFREALVEKRALGSEPVDFPLI